MKVSSFVDPKVFNPFSIKIDFESAADVETFAACLKYRLIYIENDSPSYRKIECILTHLLGIK